LPSIFIYLFTLLYNKRAVNVSLPDIDFKNVLFNFSSISNYDEHNIRIFSNSKYNGLGLWGFIYLLDNNFDGIFFWYIPNVFYIKFNNNDFPLLPCNPVKNTIICYLFSWYKHDAKYFNKYILSSLFDIIYSKNISIYLFLSVLSSY
jgi:hypothetical protein